MTINLKVILLLIIVVIVLISALGGYLIRGYLPGNNVSLPLNQELNTPPEETAPADNGNFFSAQTAIVEGVITKSTGSALTIKNNKGQIKEFPVAQNVLTIYGADEKPKTATAAPKLKEIALDKPVLINLRLTGNGYQAVSITYLPAAKSQDR